MTGPRWTVDDDGFIGWNPVTDEDGNVDWDEMIWPSDFVTSREPFHALVDCVRDSATLAKARELAAESKAAWMKGNAGNAHRAERALLDLLTGAAP